MECETLVASAWVVFERVCRRKGISEREYPEIEPIFWETVHRLWEQKTTILCMEAYCYRSMDHAVGKFLKERSRRRSLEVRLEDCNL